MAWQATVASRMRVRQQGRMMMTIQVEEVSHQVANSSVYTRVQMTCEKCSALVVVVRGEMNYVRVIVQNASNRAWRGSGKQFASAAEAVANYKKASIKSMIEHAAEIAA